MAKDAQRPNTKHRNDLRTATAQVIRKRTGFNKQDAVSELALKLAKCRENEAPTAADYQEMMNLKMDQDDLMAEPEPEEEVPQAPPLTLEQSTKKIALLEDVIQKMRADHRADLEKARGEIRAAQAEAKTAQAAARKLEADQGEKHAAHVASLEREAAARTKSREDADRHEEQWQVKGRGKKSSSPAGSPTSTSGTGPSSNAMGRQPAHKQQEQQQPPPPPPKPQPQPAKRGTSYASMAAEAKTPEARDQLQARLQGPARAPPQAVEGKMYRQVILEQPLAREVRERGQLRDGQRGLIYAITGKDPAQVYTLNTSGSRVLVVFKAEDHSAAIAALRAAPRSKILMEDPDWGTAAARDFSPGARGFARMFMWGAYRPLQEATLESLPDEKVIEAMDVLRQLPELGRMRPVPRRMIEEAAAATRGKAQRRLRVAEERRRDERREEQRAKKNGAAFKATVDAQAAAAADKGSAMAVDPPAAKPAAAATA